MFYSVCDMWGCLPIIVSTTTTTTPSTTIEETQSNVLSTDVNRVNKLVENSETVENHLIFVIATLTLIIVSTVIISAVWYRRRQKKKRSEKTKLIKIVVLMAQQSVLTDTSTVTNGQRSMTTLRTHHNSRANSHKTP